MEILFERMSELSPSCRSDTTLRRIKQCLARTVLDPKCSDDPMQGAVNLEGLFRVVPPRKDEEVTVWRAEKLISFYFRSTGTRCC